MALAAKIRPAGPDVAGIALQRSRLAGRVALSRHDPQARRQTVVDGERSAASAARVGLKALQTFRQLRHRRRHAADRLGPVAPAVHRRQDRHLLRHAGAAAPGDRPHRRQVHAAAPRSSRSTTRRKAACRPAATRRSSRRAIRRSRRRRGSSSSSSPVPKRRRSSSRRPATCRRTCARRDRSSSAPFYDKNPNFRTVSLQVERSVPWQGYPGGNSVRIWRTQREIINGVMRGEIDAEGRLRPARRRRRSALMK